MRKINVNGHMKMMKIEDAYIFAEQMMNTDGHQIDLIFTCHDNFVLNYNWDRDKELLIVNVPSTGEVFEYDDIGIYGEMRGAILLSWYHVYITHEDEFNS